MMNIHEKYMYRCLELALKGNGSVAPNPMVGAVLVFNDKIIGEGYHQQYGGPHAEVNCLNSVPENEQVNIENSVLYVSLEPCAHVGKTPPCTNLILQKGIRKVVIGCRDPFNKVNGKGVEQLKAAGVEVLEDVLKDDCIALNKRFFTFHQIQRPYIVLKWAQTLNGKIASSNQERLLISNPVTNRLVHSWRSNEAAILIGTNTALQDNPVLDNRLWFGKTPLRLLIDTQLRLPAHLHLFSDGQPLVVYNFKKNEQVGAVSYKLISPQKNLLQQILDDNYSNGLQSILVEGGAQLLQSFIDANLWDEAKIITNKHLVVEGDSVNAPTLKTLQITKKNQLLSDEIIEYKNSANQIVNNTKTNATA